MKLERRSPVGLTPAAWMAGVLVLGALAAALWLGFGLPLPACRFREWTGLPCATCGTTRMLRALLSGDLAAAAAWNPLAFLALAAAAVGSGWSAVSAVAGLGPPPWLAPGRRARRILGIVAAAAFVLGWAYLIWRGV